MIGGITVAKKDETKKDEVVKYRVGKTKNFVGFFHPKTRRFITADSNNEFIISIDDKEAIAILEDAIDVNEI
ncbi:hypothetical protein VBH21_05440 [Enterococcus hirae]|uniref:hypothetical protein n=1 Tax=Enterococcus TaxID=1350 RepID=UPI0009C042B8|nr:hypothetical protein [Enterococcus hirae]OQO39977.1 hypothetical protein BH758_13425 [Enterococcus hirae]OQO59024.1 hypothetical protein BH740_12930 [Enterococcus hirae]